jgi:hypothetical protein
VYKASRKTPLTRNTIKVTTRPYEDPVKQRGLLHLRELFVFDDGQLAYYRVGRLVSPASCVIFRPGELASILVLHQQSRSGMGVVVLTSFPGTLSRSFLGMWHPMATYDDS